MYEPTTKPWFLKVFNLREKGLESFVIYCILRTFVLDGGQEDRGKSTDLIDTL